MTRTSCLGTNTYLKYFIEKKGIFFSSVILLNFLPKNQLLLDYFWDISRDWERLQRTTTRYGRLWLMLETFY